MSLSRDAAETLALKALAWLVANDELMPVFMGATGASAEDLRSGAGDPDFLTSVLGFLTMDDAWVVAFCDATGEADYMQPMIAHQVLQGEAGRNWT